MCKKKKKCSKSYEAHQKHSQIVRLTKESTNFSDGDFYLCLSTRDAETHQFWVVEMEWRYMHFNICVVPIVSHVFNRFIANSRCENACCSKTDIYEVTEFFFCVQFHILSHFRQRDESPSWIPLFDSFSHVPHSFLSVHFSCHLQKYFSLQS